MKNIAENNVIRFKNIAKKKEGIFVNFLLTRVKGGTTFKSTICVDMAAAEVDISDPLEAIIEECARVAARDIKEPKYEFEGLQAI